MTIKNQVLSSILCSSSQLKSTKSDYVDFNPVEEHDMLENTLFLIAIL